MDTNLKLRQQNVAATVAAEGFLKQIWRYADQVFDVRLPYSPTLEGFAVMSGNLLVSRTIIRGRLRLRGDHPEIVGVLKMFLASQLGSDHIA